MTDQDAIVCVGCGLSRQAKPAREGVKLPPAWKRRGDDAFCPSCWKARFVLRAVTFPVAGPGEGTWDELRATLETCWAGSTGLANWAVAELSRRDVVRRPGDERLGAMPPCYLYPQARALFPSVDPQSVTALLRAVERRYRAARLDVVWRRAAALPGYRYPAPYPVHNQGWRAVWEEHHGTDGHVSRLPCVRLRLAGRAWVLRLAGGPGFRRQLARFAQIASGEAVPGELALYRQRSGATHRQGTEDRAAGGGQRVRYRLMAKLVAWLPRQSPGERARNLALRTAPDCFWRAVVEGREEPWVLNADHARCWQAEHRRYLDRVSEDTKYENRWPAHQRLAINEAREKRCGKYARRVNTWIQQAVACLVGFARRQKVAEVVYDDTCRDYLPEFPWHRLGVTLASKLDEYGIQCRRLASAPAVEEDPEGARTEETE